MKAAVSGIRPLIRNDLIRCATAEQMFVQRREHLPLEPAFHEHFAFITRVNGSLSPATREFIKHAQRHIELLQDTGRPPRADAP
ncbi:hypothetical protein ACFVTM_04500 [Arthrobacter sp. NPDC058130]|uniref:hypothetical protein n=1 Tax=Arthrobacter sp. NPDC058130 TaxID=3346353 RepID=UPI0036EBCB8A